MHRKIKLDIYDITLHIHKGPIKDVENKYSLESTKDFDAFCFELDDDFHIAFENKAPPHIIAHEALHVTNMIWSRIGATMDIHNDEPQCYLIAWIVRECFK